VRDRLAGLPVPVSEFPLFCGDSNANSTVVLSKSTPVCGITMDGNPGSTMPLFQTYVGAETTTLAGKVHLEYYLTAWNDPLTPPHTSTECIGYASGHWPWCDNWKTCNQWATQCQFLRNEAYLVIDADPGANDLKHDSGSVSSKISGCSGTRWTDGCSCDWRRCFSRCRTSLHRSIDRLPSGTGVRNQRKDRHTFTLDALRFLHLTSFG
jgi:hypothetical protein